MKQVCLLTGNPGSGKTSLIKQIAAEYHDNACGFYTEEIRVNDVREGFRLITLDGQTATLAHIDFASPFRIGKYGVDIDILEQTGIPALLRSDKPLVIVDEIGKMEMLSLKFRDAVLQVIASGKPVLGTVLLHHHIWSDVIKCRPDVSLLTLNRQNHAQILAGVRQWLKEIM